jgi:hypothetical protein
VTAGLEESSAHAGRWARYGPRVDPDPRWVAAVGERYARYRELAT